MGLSNDFVFHLVYEKDWVKQQSQPFYTHPSLIHEGFIHSSKKEQIEGVLSRYFNEQIPILKLTIFIPYLTSTCIFELSTDGQIFPHIYGPINKTAIVNTERIDSI